MRWFWGIQIPPPDTAVVPPIDSVRSTMVTTAPPAWAARAADRAAAPEPTTMTSAREGPGEAVTSTDSGTGQVAIELAVHVGDPSLVGPGQPGPVDAPAADGPLLAPDVGEVLQRDARPVLSVVRCEGALAGRAGKVVGGRRDGERP